VPRLTSSIVPRQQEQAATITLREQLSGTVRATEGFARRGKAIPTAQKRPYQTKRRRNHDESSGEVRASQLCLRTAFALLWFKISTI